jgi:hypothetical protein
VVEALVLEERHVELVGHQRLADVRRQRRMPGDRRQAARPSAFVGHLVALADAEGERRVVVEEERGDVVVVDDDRGVGPLLLQPLLDRGERLEDGCPHGVVALVPVVRESDGRRVRTRDCANDACHVAVLLDLHRHRAAPFMPQCGPSPAGMG